jgi:hypothetical protein
MTTFTAGVAASLFCVVIAGVPISGADEAPDALVAKLKLAFGENCDELKRRCRVYSPRFNVVLSVDRVEKLRDASLRYENLSIAQFRTVDGKDVVQATMRDVKAIVTGLGLFGDSVSKSAVFDCPDGVRLTIPQQHRNED